MQNYCIFIANLARAYCEVFLSKTSLCKRSLLSFSISSPWSLKLLFMNQTLWTFTFTEVGFIETRHSLQYIIVSCE